MTDSPPLTLYFSHCSGCEGGGRREEGELGTQCNHLLILEHWTGLDRRSNMIVHFSQTSDPNLSKHKCRVTKHQPYSITNKTLKSSQDGDNKLCCPHLTSPSLLSSPSRMSPSEVHWEHSRLAFINLANKDWGISYQVGSKGSLMDLLSSTFTFH